MREEDVRELSRRFDEVDWIYEHGYDPVHVDGEPMWEKCHCGSLHTHRGALEDIERYRRNKLARDR